MPRHAGDLDCPPIAAGFEHLETEKGGASRYGTWTVKIIKLPDTAEGFTVLPRRRFVERNFAWLGRCRLVAKD